MSEHPAITYMKGIVEVRSGSKPLHRFPYLCIEDFILRNGRAYEFGPNPYPMGPKKMCFANSYRLACKHPELTYVEGYAVREDSIEIPIVGLHAWTVTKEGKVIDPTWKKASWYFGVPFEIGYLDELIKRREYLCVLDNFEMRFPLLTGEHEYLGCGKVRADWKD